MAIIVLCFAKIKTTFEMNNIQRWDVTLFMSCGLQNYNSPGTGSLQRN